ncbi:MAG: peptide chain release factor N(5)-glutamine methyltransferase [Ignavibacteriae bacterium]|nr:peptide chain release factor N(5)-glutamine methyltransferase [Ignavibacteriota bacterium]
MQTVPLTPSQSTKAWTVLSLIEWSAQHLGSKGFDEARLHVELLLAKVLGYSRIQIYTNFDKPLDQSELAEFKTLLQRRMSHEPLQYIIGETEFMGLPLFVNPSVLIPRPETEQLVEKVLEAIRSVDSDGLEILDIGTGSGNIPVALSKFAPNVFVTSIDVSDEALQTAAVNVTRNKADRITLMKADVFSDFLPGKQFDLIVSNPPYISVEEFSLLQPEIKDFEPRIATTDDADGYRFVRRISQFSSRRLNYGGLMLMEIAYNQAREAQKIVAQAGLHGIQIFQDHSGNPRILMARRDR